MKQRILPYRQWLMPAFFSLLGIFFVSFVHGHSFLGLICFGIAAVIVCYRLIGMLKSGHLMAAKVLHAIVTTVLCLGLTVFAITEYFIIRASAGQPDAQCQYIVVLGAKVNGTSPSLALQDRIDAAYDYLSKHPQTIAVLSGGQGSDEDIPEAQCMYHELTKRGIEADRLWLESKSTSTRENLNFSLSLIEEKTGNRPASIGLISSEYHLFRAGLYAKDCGVSAIGIPARTSWFTLRLNYFPREAAGVWYYLIFGG